jgi:uncharacterized membrane protein
LTSDGDNICVNYTYTNVWVDTPCNITYSYYTDGQQTVADKGLTALTSFGDWYGVIVVVIVAIILIALIKKMAGREE